MSDYCPDANGDLCITTADWFPFRAAFGSHFGDPNYVAAFDADGDGYISGTDFFAFRSAILQEKTCPAIGFRTSSVDMDKYYYALVSVAWDDNGMHHVIHSWQENECLRISYSGPLWYEIRSTGGTLIYRQQVARRPAGQPMPEECHE